MSFREFMQNSDTGKIFGIVILIAISLSIQLPLLTQLPTMMVDEPWYANPAYNVSIGEGYINTNVGSGGFQGAFVYTTGLALFYKLVGCSLFTSRLFSVLSGAVGLIGLLFIIRRFTDRLWIIFFSGLLIIFSNVHYIIFRSVRPEGLTVVFIIWAAYFFLRTLDEKQPLSPLFSGLLVSSSFLCHPHGAIFILIFGMLIFANSIKTGRWLEFTLYLAGCSAMGIVFILYLSSISSVSVHVTISNWLFRTAFGDSPAYQTSTLELIKEFCKNYTLGAKRLYILIFEIGILVLGLFYYRKKRVVFQFSILGLGYLVISFLFLSKFSTRHFGDVTTFSFIVFALILSDLTVKDRSKQKYILIILGALYLFNNMAGDFYVMARDFRKTPYSKIEKQIGELVPDNTKVLTLLHFWFPLRNNAIYNSYTRWDHKGYDSLDDLLNSGDLDYVVISDFMTKSTTGTSGRDVKDSKVRKRKKYYNRVLSYARFKGNLVEKIQTTNYGDIFVFKIPE